MNKTKATNGRGPDSSFRLQEGGPALAKPAMSRVLSSSLNVSPNLVAKFTKENRSGGAGKAGPKDGRHEKYTVWQETAEG
jgi:hypothetical protein